MNRISSVTIPKWDNRASFAHTPWPSTIFPASSTRYTLFSASFDGCLGVIIRRNFRRDSASCFSSSIFVESVSATCSWNLVRISWSAGSLWASGYSRNTQCSRVHTSRRAVRISSLYNCLTWAIFYGARNNLLQKGVDTWGDETERKTKGRTVQFLWNLRMERSCSNQMRPTCVNGS